VTGTDWDEMTFNYRIKRFTTGSLEELQKINAGVRQNLWVETDENGEICGSVKGGFSEGWQGK
jgi:hypothetical protein